MTRLDPRDAARRIARAFLATPPVEPALGQITLAPHQTDAASRILAMIAAHDGALLADTTGMGKTFVALAVARAMESALVVAPAALRRMWRDAMQRSRVAVPFVSYEALSRGTPVAERSPLLILDEGTTRATRRRAGTTRWPTWLGARGCWRSPRRRSTTGGATCAPSSPSSSARRPMPSRTRRRCAS